MKKQLKITQTEFEAFLKVRDILINADMDINDHSGAEFEVCYLGEKMGWHKDSEGAQSLNEWIDLSVRLRAARASAQKGRSLLVNADIETFAQIASRAQKGRK